jgi:uncharacterized membrane protein
MNASPQEWPTVFFPDSVLYLLIIGALALTAIAAVALVWMLVRDRRNNRIW